jgi:type I restriction enzyme, R subunit
MTHIALSFHLDVEDLDYTPFDRQRGRGKMHQLFEGQMDAIIDELNEVLVA